MSPIFRSRMVVLMSSSALGIAIAAMPINVDPVQRDAAYSIAHAKGGGGGGAGGAGGGNAGGNSGGNSGGNAGGHGGGHGGGHAGQGQGHGQAADHGRGLGRGEGAPTGRGHSGHGHGAAQHGRGAIASQLGKMNAAHASLTALANAAPMSVVGMIAAYRDAVEDQTITTVTQAQTELGKISNKSVNSEVVAAVNDLLGVGPLGD